MNNIKFIKPELIHSCDLPPVSERWIEDRLANDPGLLGMEACKLIKREYPISPDGRVDLLLESVNQFRRYVVEVQLGSFDDHHLTRLVDYHCLLADKEPVMETVAVAAAESFTPRAIRFCRAISKIVPFRLIGLIFVRLDNDFTMVPARLFDSTYDRNASASDLIDTVTPTCALHVRTTPDVHDLINSIGHFVCGHDIRLGLSWTKAYVGLSVLCNPSNCIIIRPRMNNIIIEFRLDNSAEHTELISALGNDYLGYDEKRGRYRARFWPHQSADTREIMINLCLDAIDSCPVIAAAPKS